MQTWYKMRHKLSHEYNIEHNTYFKYKSTAALHNTYRLEHNRLEIIISTLMQSNNKMYMNCGIIAIFMSIILSCKHNGLLL